MSIIIDVIEQPPAVIDVLQSTATVVEVLTPGGVAAVLSPLVYNPNTQTLSFDQSLLTGLPPSAVTGTAVVNADPRLTNARTPTAHKATHATGGSDALTPADIGAEPLGAAASSMSSHLAAADPHSQYTTAAEAAAAAPVQSVAGKTGTVTLTPADVGADATGTAAAAVTAHEAAADPHTQYTTAARVRAVVLTGLSTAVNAAVTAADTILGALGKLQAQLTAHVGTGGAAHAEATTSTAGFLAAADKTKLDGIAAGATANSSDAQLRDRSTHTGSQAISTVTGLQTALDGKEAVGAATNSMATHLAAADPHSQYTTAAEAAAAAPVQSVAGRTGTVTLAAADITDSTAAGRSVLTAADAAAQRTALGLVLGTDVQAYDADLQAIAALTGTAGLLRKTAANTWSLDTASYLTGNQTVTVTGDATGSGATSIALTLANSGVTAGTYRSVTVDAKGRVTAGTNPTTLSGYGITDAQPLDSDLTAIAALTHAADGFLVSDGSAWTRKTPADALVSLGLGTPTGTGNVVRATSPTIASPTISGVLSLAAGTALLPSLASTSDLDTGMWFPAANTVAWSTGGLEAMRISSARNVGIGTTAPDAGLTVINSATISSQNNVAARIGAGVTSDLLLGSINGNTPFVASQGAYPLDFYTNALLRMRITSAGETLLGTSTGYGGRLTVIPAATPITVATANQVQIGEATGNTGYRLQVGYFNSGFGFFGSIQAYDAGNPTNLNLNGAGGNVGIGTTSPSTWGKFAVVGSASGSQVVAAIVNTAGTANTQAVLSFDTTSNGFNVRDSQIRSTNSGTNATTLEFYTSNGASPTEKMRITSAGNVGIGTTSPGALLHVAGAGLFRATLAGTAATLPAESASLSVLNGAGYGTTPSVSFNIGANNWDAVNNNNTFQWSLTTLSPGAGAGLELNINSRSFDGTSTYTTTPRLTIGAAGNTAIGTTITSGARLTVRGSGTSSSTTGLLVEDSGGTDNLVIRDDGAYAFRGGTVGLAQTGYTTFTNLTTDRTCDADNTTVAELADILGTLIVDLKTKGIIAS